MSKEVFTKLGRLQLSLYNKAFSEAYSIPSISSPTLLAYSQDYIESIPDTFSRVNLDYFIDAINRSSFVLYGDFHTLIQSQRGLLRLLRAFREKYSKRNIIIALEMCQANDQKIMDDYLAGRISELEFLDACRYDETWGFPWEGYKSVLNYAKQNEISVIGLNKDKSGSSKLRDRDIFASKVLKNLHIENPDSLIVSLIGEFHLADNHLIHHLDEELKQKNIDSKKILRILTNIDKYSLQGSPRTLSQSTEYLHLKENLLCILNTPPWIKWKSYVLWEEMKNTNIHFSDELFTSNDDSDLFTEESFDVDYHIFNITKDLMFFLNIKIDLSKIGNFNSIHLPDDDFFSSTKKELALTKKEIKSIRERLGIDGFYFLPHNHLFIFSDYLLNNLSNAAGQFLYNLTLDRDWKGFTDEEKFIHNIIRWAMGMVSTKILNPRKKSKDLWYFIRYLYKNRGKKLKGYANLKRETARKILLFHNRLSIYYAKGKIDKFKIPETVILSDKDFHYEISKSIGQVLGYTLYSRYVGQTISLQPLINLLNKAKTKEEGICSLFYDFYIEVMH